MGRNEAESRNRVQMVLCRLTQATVDALDRTWSAEGYSSRNDAVENIFLDWIASKRRFRPIGLAKRPHRKYKWKSLTNRARSTPRGCKRPRKGYEPRGKGKKKARV